MLTLAGKILKISIFYIMYLMIPCDRIHSYREREKPIEAFQIIINLQKHIKQI